VDGADDLVYLSFGIAPACVKAFGQVTEDSLALLPLARNAFEPAVLHEIAEHFAVIGVQI
jgi:hypothetical protein